MLLANGSSAFFTKGNPDFSNGPKSLPKNLHDCPILCIDTSVIINNNFCRKSFSSLESSAIFGKSFKASLVLFLIPDFNLLSCELGNFILSHFILTLH